MERFIFMTSRNNFLEKAILSYLSDSYEINDIKDIIYKTNLEKISSSNTYLKKIPNSNLMLFRPEFLIIFEKDNELKNVIVNYSETSLSLKQLSITNMQATISNSSYALLISNLGLSHDLYNILLISENTKSKLLNFKNRKIHILRYNSKKELEKEIY